MSSYNKLAEELSEYGITRNQAKVYIVAAKFGIASISQISRISNIPREEVYRLLPKLENMGLIEKTVERPMRVKASNLTTVLSILISQKRDTILREISKLEQKRDRILDEFEKLNMVSKSSESAHVTLIRQRQAIIQKIVTMIEDSKKTVSLSITRDQFIQFFTSYRSQIIRALNRDVEFRVVLENTEYSESIEEFLKELEKMGRITIRFVDQQQSHYILKDYEQALVSTSMKHAAFGNKINMWTDDKELINLSKENFEIMWLTSKDINAIKTDDGNKLRTYLHDLLPTEHLALIYKTAESKYDVLSNYLKFGLENAEAVICIIPGEEQQQVREALKQIGVDVKKNEKAGALKIIPDNEFYVIDGKFNIATTLEIVKQLHDDATEKGFKGCRIFGDSSCFFQNDLIEELIEFEKTLGRVLAMPIIGMCPYNSETLYKCDSPEEKIKELLQTHGKVLFMGKDGQLEKIEVR